MSTAGLPDGLGAISVRVRVAAAMIGISRSRIYELIDEVSWKPSRSANARSS